jgi:hypothetical protein
MNLAAVGFVIENEWYWRISENAQSFDVTAAVRDFLAPLARHAKGKLALTDIAADLDAVSFTLGETQHVLKVTVGLPDRTAINQFVRELNCALAPAGFAFALVTPRRYELRGVLLTIGELAGLIGNSALMIPTLRASSPSIPPG